MKIQKNNHMKSPFFKNINGWLALAGRTFALILYAFSFLSIRNKHLWAFGSASSFSGNSKYLLQYVIEHHPEIMSCWITKRKEEVSILRNKGINAYYTYSIKGIYYSLIAKYYIVNSSLGDINFYTSGGCKYIQLWHGVGLKCCLWNNKRSIMNTNNKLIGFIKRPSYYIKPNFILGASKLMNKIFFSSMFRTDISRCHSFLYPRCWPLYEPKEELLSYIKRWEDDQMMKFVEYISKFSSVYLYMPTYRDANPYFLAEQNWNLVELNEFLRINNALLIVKLHPGISIEVDYGGFDHIVEMNKYMDVYPILPFTDTLITDYSSIYYEYILMKNKQIILYIPDKEDYISHSRDLLLKYEDNCRGIVVNDFNGLLSALLLHEAIDYEDLRVKFWGNDIDCDKEALYQTLLK